MWGIKGQQKTKLGDEIESGQKVTTTGYYVYNGHVNPSEYDPKSCFIADKLKVGIFLVGDNSSAPGTMCCNHKIRLKLDQIPEKKKIDRSEYHRDVRGLPKTKEGELIESGQWITTTGTYVYAGHVNPDEYSNCFISEKIRDGMYLTKGSKMIGTGSCPHKISWKLIEAEKYPSLGPGEYFPQDIRDEIDRNGSMRRAQRNGSKA
ncbi:MAG: hypothetical protein KGH52_01420 [Candidatus Micrarchaeota archaeon]|nr:hypothetical protein [Candidatus Micrarchaeota archaeon]